MTYVAVLPYVYLPYFDACMATIKLPEENLLFIDNTVSNLGIMRSHNMGIDFMKVQDADWLIIISAAIRFGPKGGLDFAQILEDHPDYYVIHAASENVKGGKQQEGGGGRNEIFGWHLTAFHRRVFDAIGRWDENFSPYGLDDLDLSLRLQKHFKGAPGWDTFPCDVHDTTMGHSINFSGVISPYEPRQQYFIHKWGRDPADWEDPGYEHPFDNSENSLAYWPDAPNGGKWND